MSLSNTEQLYLSKLVYSDYTDDGKKEYGGYPVDIDKFATYHFNRKVDQLECYIYGGENKGLDPIKVEELNMLKRIANGEVLAGYKLVDMRNENMTTGFVGAVFEKNDGEVVVAFRGSETSEGQILADWIRADGGLIAVPTTAQQQSAENYMHHIEEKYGAQYDKFYTVGHAYPWWKRY